MTNQKVIEILLNEQKCLDRNDGVQCDRKCESCDLVMDAETIREAYSMAISALQAQDLQPTCNQLATDTISRTATIGAIVNTVSEIGLHDNSEVARYGATFRQHEIIDIIEGMPSAQLDVPEINDGDMISRQAAIDVIDAVFPVDPMKSEYAQGIACGAALAKTYVEQLPSAQLKPQWIPVSERLPEDYTDVLVWFEYFRYGDYNCLYQTYGIGDYGTKYDSWTINHETGWHKLRVIAWMPLPEPYAERRTDE